MLVSVVMAVLLGVAVWWIGEGYAKDVPSVVSGLPRGKRWPWITALALLVLALVSMMGTELALLSGGGGDDSGIRSWEFALLGVPLLLAGCVWLACYRPLRSALLLVAAWVSVPVALGVQVFLLSPPLTGQEGQDAFFAPFFYAVFLAPSAVVALLLLMTARNLDRQVPHAVFSGAAAEESGASPAPPVEHAGRWGTLLTVSQVTATVLLLLGVVAMVVWSINRTNFIGNQTRNPQLLDYLPVLLPAGLAVTLLILMVLVWVRPRLAGFLLLGTALAVAGLGVAAALVEHDLTVSWQHVAGTTAVYYGVPAIGVSVLLFFVGWLKQQPTRSVAPSMGSTLAASAASPAAPAVGCSVVTGDPGRGSDRASGSRVGDD